MGRSAAPSPKLLTPCQQHPPTTSQHRKFQCPNVAQPASTSKKLMVSGSMTFYVGNGEWLKLLRHTTLHVRCKEETSARTCCNQIGPNQRFELQDAAKFSFKSAAKNTGNIQDTRDFSRTCGSIPAAPLKNRHI